MTYPTTFAALADLSVEFVPPSPAGLDDAQLLAAKRDLAEIRRRLDATDALLAAEIAVRSRPELGYDGLAQRLGARTPEKLIQTVSGVSARDARTQVRVGSLVASLESPPAPGDAGSPTEVVMPVETWMRPVAALVSSGELSLEAAEAIRAGLGSPTAEVSAEMLLDAATTLVGEVASVGLDRLAARARDVRAALDVAFVAEREKLLREKRYLNLTRLPDGMTRMTALLDPESAAQVVAVFDAATSPRRGGPRFVDPTVAAAADAVAHDSRTTEQLALDTFVELLRLGTHADVTAFIGARRPAVQVLVTKADLDGGEGFGFIEGQSDAVSIATVERHVCESGAVPILFDNGEVVNLGRELRLFSRRQRIALAARDGGCVWPDCDRPPSWCEAHHINEWVAHHGRTDISDGVLLCKHHHLLVHNNGWRVSREGASYALVPPPEIDPTRTPRPLATKSAAMRRLVQGGRT
jgi:hypothetical protein